ncbi:bifunctional DNA-formamidopyrimidine glycosylase/DNA-(apurinic or apyrimidinic site) lyase [Enterobacteriaceae endosymbiont of Plateumaris consimilis]|uniref:bifunctional DNA-formamidopyrimidine glycosylase/DNA-(apurinic or apyrimidinic site) lyase n=1 Tax=Enterobacteriaceae endosymbiont of Plateumaris consimilis TaxID=2675794 RepID=UPI00144A1DB2|nr:bifunctional DNA-formamidopyrimidine glycosylase/DNA-(apurinic or apyrimidinic site) lyase [Enterobacteriaceae endosymbiont of Plateumaris consimilis]QJC28828.1 bifunctional DNA-formamidopyrimidine glycosylase/DNA-(apurinic or apyrimidinic site) lyase [Enterobacteriaceae endosymbiont of Plateumaris consimilis]
MPELPEIEVIKNIIYPYLKGNNINYSIIRNRKLKYLIPQEIISISNEKIINIKRRGRYIIFILKNNSIIIHLGMTGNLLIIQNNKKIKTYDHIDLVINNHIILRYSDIRKFGFWIWYNSKHYKNSIFIKKLGPEPLTNTFNSLYLYRITQKKKIPIKVLLMMNEIVVGIGNIYSSESLFISKILPYRKANTLTFIEISILVKNIKYILYKSIKNGGTSIYNYIDPYGRKGNYSKFLFVYKRNNKLCKICKTKILKMIHRNRSTFFCSVCQI